MPVNIVSRTATIASLTVAQDGSMITYTAGGSTLRRSFGQSDRAVAAFLLGNARSGTVSNITVSDIDNRTLELIKVGGARFTAALGREERELAAFLFA